MFSKKKFINITAFALINCVSILFFIKYAVLYTGHPFILSFLYIVVSTGVTLLAGNISDHFNLFNRKFLVVFTVLLSAGVLLYILLVPRMGEIGRYPAIIDWIDRLLADKFPYNSPHTPSSYPVIFLLAYPFYLIGNIGILEVLGTSLYFWFILRSEGTAREMAVKIVMLLSSLVFYYEIVTRSELFFNVMLIAGAVYFSEKFLLPEKININFISAALLTGLVITTRSVAALLFLIYFMYKFRFDLKNLILFGIISLAVFFSFIVPIYLLDAESFMNNGPFAVQSYLSNLPLVVIILLFASSLYAGWAIADIQEFFFSGGVILFIAAAVSFLIRVSDLSFSEALYNDGYDIAYFIFCVPLLLLSVKDYKTDMYLGKVAA